MMRGSGRVHKRILVVAIIAVAAAFFVVVSFSRPAQLGNPPSLFEQPSLVLLDEQRDRAFVLNAHSGTIVGLRASTKEAVGRIAAAPHAQAMALNAQNGDLYVLDTLLNSVVIVKAGAWSGGSAGSATSTVQRLLVGKQPGSLVADSSRNRLYVTNFGDNSVSVIDLTQARVVATLSVGQGPRQVVVHPRTGLVYVANELERSVSVVREGGAAVAETILLPIAPRYLRLDATRDILYAAPQPGASLVRLSLAPDAQPQELVVGQGPMTFALDEASGTLYASLFAAEKLVAVSPEGTVRASLALPTGVFPGQPAFEPSTKRLFLPLTGTNEIAVVDGEALRVTKTLPSGTNTDQATLNTRTGEAYFVNRESDTLTIVKTATFETSFLPAGKDPRAVVRRGGPVFDFPLSAAVNEADNLIYVVNNTGAFLTVIDGRSDAPVRTVNVSRNPRTALFVADVGKLYVASGDDDVVNVLDRQATRVRKHIAVGKKPRLLRYHSPTKRLFVVNQDSNSVSVVDAATDTVVATIGVGASPGSAALQPMGSRLAVLNRTDPSVSIIDVGELKEIGRVSLSGTALAVVAPSEGSRAFVLLRSPDAVAVVDMQAARLEKAITLTGAAAFLAAAEAGLVVAQNTIDGGAEIMLVDEVGLDTKYRVRLARAIAVVGTAPVVTATDQVLFRDLETQKRLERFATGEQSVAEVGTLPFVASSYVLNQKTGKLYVLHAGQNALSVVEIASGRVSRVLNNRTPIGTPLLTMGLGIAGVLAVLIGLLLLWQQFSRRGQSSPSWGG